MDKNLNVTLIKNILYNEIKKYFDYSNKISKIESKYNLVDEILNILKEKNYKMWVETYEKVYGKPLKYLTKEDKGE